MLNTDERLYYAGAGDTLKTLLIHIYQEEAYKRKPEDKSIEQDFANRAKQIATSVRDAYLALLDVSLPKGKAESLDNYTHNISKEIARSLRGILADELKQELPSDSTDTETANEQAARLIASIAVNILPQGGFLAGSVLAKAREIVDSRTLGVRP